MNMNTFCMEDFHAPVKSILYMYFINRVPMVKEDAVTTSVKVKQIYIKKNPSTGHIFYFIGPIWLTLHPNSAFDKRVCCNIE